MDIADPYTAFCFDEACTYIIGKMNQKDGPQPVWDEDRKKVKKQYGSFSQLYGSLQLVNLPQMKR